MLIERPIRFSITLPEFRNADGDPGPLVLGLPRSPSQDRLLFKDTKGNVRKAGRCRSLYRVGTPSGIATSKA